MYAALKRIARALLPAKTITAPRSLVRRGLYLFYKGDTYTCNICAARLKNFIALDNGEKICPLCGSSARNRRVWQMIRELNTAGKKILEFSPNAAMRIAMKQTFGSSYICSDWEDEFTADKKLDITRIDEADNSYDIIILFHVLEHITDDTKAMAEVFRILKAGGIALIQTPFKEGSIYEDFSVTAPEERLKHFGQEDHVRVYSASGLKGRLEQAGFNVTLKVFREVPENINGLLQQETVLLAQKS